MFTLWPYTGTFAELCSMAIKSQTPFKQLYVHIQSQKNYSQSLKSRDSSSVHQWKNRRIVIYTCNGVLFSHKNKWSIDTFCATDGPWKHYARWKKTDTKVTGVLFYLCEISTIGRPSMGRQGKEWLLNEHMAPLRSNENGLEVDRVVSYTHCDCARCHYIDCFKWLFYVGVIAIKKLSSQTIIFSF